MDKTSCTHKDEDTVAYREGFRDFGQDLRDILYLYKHDDGHKEARNRHQEGRAQHWLP